MTQFATFDVGAIAARRDAATTTARQKPQADFGQAFERAENQYAEARPDARVDARRHFRADKADQADEPQEDVQADATEADDAQDAVADARQAKADQADRLADARQADRQADARQADRQADVQQAKAQQADRQADRLSDARQADRHADAKQADRKADAKQDNAGQAADQPQAPDANQAPASQQAQDTTQTQQAMDPQDALQLMLATGAQLAVTRQADAANAQAQAATTLTAVDANAQAQVQVQQAQPQDQAAAQAASQATTQPAAQPQAQQAQQAQAQAQPQQQAQAQAQATPVVPDLLAQAAGALGPIKVTVGKVEQPTNLTVALLDDQAEATTEGPIAQVTKLDGAIGIETASQLPVDLLPTEADDDHPEAKLNADVQPATAQINPEPKAEQAKAADKGTAPAAPHEVIKQILDRADQIKGAQQNAIKLQLYPEHLGKMEIRVMSHEGVISAQLSADTPQAKAMLDGQLATLQRSFAEMGLKVDKVEVTLSSANLDANGGSSAFTGFDQQQHQQQREPQHQAMRQGAGLGYEQWLPEPQGDDGYVVTGSDAGINYVA